MIQSYRECLQAAKKNSLNRNVLLGNGFSIGLHKPFENLLLASDIKNSDDKFQELFDYLKTSDFEKVMATITDPQKVLSILQKELDFNSERYVASIRKIFLDSISNAHPRSHEELGVPFENAKNFLMEFSNIFTTNYDLTLYWLINKHIAEKTKKWNDGFYKENRVLLWCSPGHQNVFCLHGALHIYSLPNGEITKDVNLHPGPNLITQLSTNLKENRWPMIVLEGSSEQKVMAINTSPYLKNASERLKQIGGSIFIHGVGFNENDQHIYDAIFENAGLIKIYIGIEPSDKAIVNRIEKVSKGSPRRRKITYYDRNTVYL